MKAVGILVPVHDEEANLADCLRALRLAVANVADDVECAVVLVLDACTDDSAAVASRELALMDGSIVSIEQRNVGAARARGASELLARFAAVPRNGLWLATTDADSTVPADWITEQLRIASAGFEAVAGTVQVADWKGYPPQRASAYGTFYEAGGDEHPHVHGANLGFRADAYLAAGGFAPSSTGEDVALWHALGVTGRRRLSTRRISVTTSARLEGRAPRGFASFLTTFARAG